MRGESYGISRANENQSLVNKIPLDLKIDLDLLVSGANSRDDLS
jgi:hypothetical protein